MKQSDSDWVVMLRRLLLLVALLPAQAFAQYVIPCASACYYTAPPSNTIPGTPTDAYLLANYPAASYSGYTANTSDMGTESSDGVNWYFTGAGMPVPAAAQAAGYTKLLFAYHPNINQICLNGQGAGSCYLYGNPGYGGTQVSGFFTTTNGQLTLVNSNGSNTNFPSLATVVTVGNTTVANSTGLLPLIPASGGYYTEAAYTLSTNNADHWDAFWTWTVEKNLGTTTQWVEFDINEDGTRTAGMFSTAHYWNGGTNTQGYVQSGLYNGSDLDLTTEHIYGGVFNPTAQTFDRWLDGSQTGVWGSFTKNNNGSTGNIAETTFTNISLPTAAYSGLHQFLIVDADSHGGAVSYNAQVRYFSVWVSP
jgi:hypothetical protein